MIVFNPFKPEFTIVIFIHYKPRIAVAILDLQWMKMTWSSLKNKENDHVLVNQFHGNIHSKTLGYGKIKSVFRDVKWCFIASWGLKGLNDLQNNMQAYPHEITIIPLFWQINYYNYVSHMLSRAQTITFQKANHTSVVYICLSTVYSVQKESHHYGIDLISLLNRLIRFGNTDFHLDRARRSLPPPPPAQSGQRSVTLIWISLI